MADYLLRDGVAVTRLLHDVVVMAGESEVTHRGNPAWPAGLSGGLEMLLREFRAHDAREDTAYRAALNGEQGGPVLERLLKDHVSLRLLLSALREQTDGYRPPANACTAWRLLNLICLKVERLILARIEVEEGRLFPIAFGFRPEAFDAEQGLALARGPQ